MSCFFRNFIKTIFNDDDDDDENIFKHKQARIDTNILGIVFTIIYD